MLQPHCTHREIYSETHGGYYIVLKKCQIVSAQESQEIIKESKEQKLVDESVNKHRFIPKTPSKKEAEKNEDTGFYQETEQDIITWAWLHQEKNQVKLQVQVGM